MTWNRTGNIRGPGGPSGFSAYVLFGHSLTAAGGVTGNTSRRAWHNLFAALSRAHVWDQGVGGAVLAKAGLNRGTSGYGGVREVLQGLVVNPYTGTNWRGAYAAGTSYAPGDGVSSGGNWYRLEGSVVSTGTAPPGGNWVQVVPGSQLSAAGYAGANFYLGQTRVPILWYGNNDIGWVYQSNQQPFLTAMETILARACASAVYDAASPMIAYAGGGATTANNYAGSGTSVRSMVAGETVTFVTPSDWPGGFVDFMFVPIADATGAIAFTVDGVATNVTCSGVSNSNLVDFQNPKRYHYDGTSLTTALAAGVAVTNLAVVALSEAVNSGATVVVGSGATADTFTASAAAAAGATSIAVTSKAPVNAHPVNDFVYDSTQGAPSHFNNVVTVRVPTGAGSHTIVATVQATPAPANLYGVGVALESPTPPPIFVPGLMYFATYGNPWTDRQLNDAMIDTWNTGLQALLSQFPTAVYIDTTTLIRPGAKLTTALTAGQAAVTQLAVQPLPYAVAAGDFIEIGSGVTQQEVQASGPAAVGATSIPVNSFTSTYDQPIGTWVWDATVVEPNIGNDNIHPSDVGHEIIASAFYNAILQQAAKMTTQQIARVSAPLGEPKTAQRYATTNLTVGTGTAGAWGAVKIGTAIPTLYLPADPGDVVEVDIEGVWNTVTGSAGYLDIATFDYYTNTAISFFSGSQYMGGNAGTSGLGGDAVLAQQGNGIAALMLSGVASLYQPATGRFAYVVQVADIRQGGVYFALWGKSSVAATQALLASGGSPFFWAARNKGPMSNAAQAA